MTSEKRKRASQKNGRHGGVKTEAGKAVSKMNALKHGVLATTPHDPIFTEEIYSRLAEEYGTKPFSRQILVEQLALTVKRLACCVRAEADIFTEGFSNETQRFVMIERLGVIYERYEPRLVNRYLRLLEALKNSK